MPTEPWLNDALNPAPPDDGGLMEFEKYCAALRLMKAVAAAKRELDKNDNRLSWQTRIEVSRALTGARVWFNVPEEELDNEP